MLLIQWFCTEMLLDRSVGRITDFCSQSLTESQRQIYKSVSSTYLLLYDSYEYRVLHKASESKQQSHVCGLLVHYILQYEQCYESTILYLYGS